jgi:hypothetical protein
MPTARELLEQADALMRRNRGGDSGIPVLTDRVPDSRIEVSRRGPSTRAPAAGARAPRSEKGRDDRTAPGSTAAASAPQGSEPARQPVAAPPVAELPVLTDAVEEIAIDQRPLPAEQAEGEPSLWLGPDTVDPSLHSITGPAPDTVAVVPPVTLRAALSSSDTEQSVNAELPDPTVTRTFRAAGSATMPPPAGSIPPETTPDKTSGAAASGDERWQALAEQISMQVLQRLDLFIDTGLKEQLAAHLEPIVARAGAELVETINEHVGQLVRSYVAEAIEREIAQWRREQR